MRRLNDHIITEDDNNLKVMSLDEPGPGGAYHVYEITGYDASLRSDSENSDSLRILFQKGPIKEAGVNGITQEVLLTVVLDRLRSFQDSPFRCKENACAITHIEEALHWLQQRTIQRLRRGVEGKDIV